MRRWALFYVGLVVVAFAIGIASGARVEDSPIPSTNNPGPHGVKLLYALLSQTGHDVRRLDQSLIPLPGDLKTLVLVAPKGHGVSEEEKAAIEAFVQRGGTLVYLAPRRSDVQHELDTWLDLKSGPAATQPPTDTQADDLIGVSDRVALQGGPLAAAKTLRVIADDSVVAGGDAVAVTAHQMLWFRRMGWGEIWVGAGADLAEGARLELDDNLLFWTGLAARGPMAFDEVHQVAKTAPAWSANLVASLVQLLVCALAFVLVFGARLGPARVTPAVKNRSSLEYVQSMAALTRSARIEPELAAEQVERLRRLERLPEGVSLDAEKVQSPAEFLAFSRRCAALEIER